MGWGEGEGGLLMLIKCILSEKTKNVLMFICFIYYFKLN